MRRLIILLCILFMAAVALVQLHTTYAQGSATPAPVTDNDVNRVARGLYCPVCQNVPLEVCETQACVQWREQIRDLLTQGYTDEQIRQRFIEQYGTKTVGVPVTSTGILLTVILPFALIGLIGVVIVINLSKWRLHRRNGLQSGAIDREQAPQASQTLPLDDYHKQLEEEIRKRE